MTASIILAVFAFVSTVVTVTVPLYKSRSKGPESTALLLTASATYFAEVHDRLETLELRLSQLEKENRRYFDLHGPLPREFEL
jgi:hypothetical protein